MFELTPEQEEIRRVCRDFAAREIRPAAAAVDAAEDGVPLDLWHKAAAIGLTGFMLPEALGGGGMTDALTGCLVQEELCHGCAGIGNLITSNGFFAEPVLTLGTEAQQERWLRPLTGDRPPLTALATTEPDAGSDAAAMRTRARKVDGGYVLDGQKAWISNGGDRAVLRRLRHGRARHRPPRRHRLPARPRRRGALVRRADPRRWASARSRTPSCSCRTASSPTTAGSAARARASAG